MGSQSDLDIGYHTQAYISVYQGADCLQQRRGYNPDRHGSCVGQPISPSLRDELKSAITAVSENHKLLEDPQIGLSYASVKFHDQIRAGDRHEILHRIQEGLEGFHAHTSFSDRVR